MGKGKSDTLSPRIRNEKTTHHRIFFGVTVNKNVGVESKYPITCKYQSACYWGSYVGWRQIDLPNKANPPPRPVHLFEPVRLVVGSFGGFAPPTGDGRILA